MKKNFRFQCVDDEQNADTLCNILQDSAKLASIKICRRNPSTWEMEVAHIISQTKESKIDGLLLDYRLDEKADTANCSDAVPVSYTADSLVQELRRRSLEDGKDSSFPIILWSNAARLDDFYGVDPKFRQHYDCVINKEDITTRASEISDTLISFAKGYAILRKADLSSKEISSFLKPPQNGLTISADSFFSMFFTSGVFAYHRALFIIHEILESDGPLIGQNMLKAILAVDLDHLNSGKAKDYLADFQYRGVFSEAFPRYWRVPLIQSLNELAGQKQNWMALDATARAQLLKKKFNFRKLAAIEPIQPNYSSIYDTFCVHSKRPLNRMNGFSLFDESPRVWKDTRFISAFELRRNYSAEKKCFRLEEGEKRRFQAMFSGK